MPTDRERATLRFIREYQLENGYPPKLREIAKGIGVRSKGVVHRHVRALAAEGVLEIIPEKHRGIRLKGARSDGRVPGSTLPLMGKIAAGAPIEAIPDQETVSLLESLGRSDCFALKVSGDSMVEAGILDGDVVIVEQRDVAEDGEIVAALVDGDEATVKRLQRSSTTITLIPANNSMQPMVYEAERVRIQGVIIGQMRSYRSGKPHRIC